MIHVRGSAGEWFVACVRAVLLTLVALPLLAPGASAAAAPEDSAIVRPAPRDYLAEARAAFTPENRAYQRQRVATAMTSE